MNNKSSSEIAEPSNGAASAIALSEPYTVVATIEGSADLLLHRWNCEAIEAKASARKNSAAKKTDDLESYVYRTERGTLAIPGEYFRMAILGAAKFRPDPRSPRKSAADLYKAGIVALDVLCDTGKRSWDYEDKRRAVVQRAGINRTRPALKTGWTVKVSLLVLLPEYIAEADLHELLGTAGRLIGVGDFRPTFGRFFVRNLKRV